MDYPLQIDNDREKYCDTKCSFSDFVPQSDWPRKTGANMIRLGYSVKDQGCQAASKSEALRMAPKYSREGYRTGRKPAA